MPGAMGSPDTAGSAHWCLCQEDEYMWTLSPELKKMVRRDLREDENARNQALQNLRSWIKRHPNIQRCRLDSNFLLRFLRMKKFSVPLAQDVIEKYLRMRQEHPAWFQNLDVHEPTLNELISAGYIFALPQRDHSGRRVIFSIASALDPNKYSASDMMRTSILTFESLLEDEENQIRGFTYIFDEQGVGFSHLTLWNIADVTKAFNCCEKALPMRHKEIHFLHLPTAIIAVFEFAKSLLSDKIKNRFQVHYDEASLRKKISPQILPQEYGGEVPLAEMIESWKQELSAMRDKVIALDDMKIEVPKCGSETQRLDSDVMGMQGSFRRLEID